MWKVKLGHKKEPMKNRNKNGNKFQEHTKTDDTNLQLGFFRVNKISTRKDPRVVKPFCEGKAEG